MVVVNAKPVSAIYQRLHTLERSILQTGTGVFSQPKLILT